MIDEAAKKAKRIDMRKKLMFLENEHKFNEYYNKIHSTMLAQFNQYRNDGEEICEPVIRYSRTNTIQIYYGTEHVDYNKLLFSRNVSSNATELSETIEISYKFDGLNICGVMHLEAMIPDDVRQTLKDCGFVTTESIDYEAMHCQI